MQQNIFDNETFFNKYIKLRRNPIGHNELIEKPAFISLLPKLKGSNVLDLGCGHGDLSREIIKNGATKVVGVDISKRMLEHTKLYQNHNIEYINADMMCLKDLGYEFDLVVSSLSFHYLENVETVFEYVSRSLKMNGYFVFSVEHPIYTSPSKNNDDSWVLEDSGAKESWILDSYFSEEKRIKDWIIPNVEKYHRKFETYFTLLIKYSFTVESVLEPSADFEVLKKNKNLYYENIRPAYLLFKAKKILK
jgi:ubiquinone/menaquinone biosynthesis C-methylase UbiE